MAAFRERFNKSPPQRATLLDWKKYERSLLDVLKTGRGVGERQRAWKHAAVAVSIESSSMKSTRKRSSGLGVLRAVLCCVNLN
jgi:hypothetical protein